MILSFLFFIIGLIWGIKNKYIVPFYYVIWITLLPYFVDKVIPFKEVENLFSFRTFASYYIFSMLGTQIINKNNTLIISKNIENIIISLVLLILYFSFLSFIRGVGFNYLSYLRTNLSPIFLYLYLSIVTPNKNIIIKFILITVILQISVGLIQWFTSFGNFSFNQKGTGVVSFMTGGFTGNNLYSDFLAVVSILLLLEFKYNKILFLRKLVPFLIIISAYLIFNSGIRLSLAVLLIGVIIHLFVDYKKTRKIITIITVSSVILLFFGKLSIPVESAVSDWHVTSNSERQSGLLGVFKGWEYLQYSTIFYSWVLISEYFINNPIFGSGLYFSSAGYSGIISFKTSNATDVTLALFITEFGILGLLLLFYYFKVILYNNCKPFFKKKLLIPIIVIILISITDSGIFDTVIMSYLYLFIFIHQPIKLENNENYNF